MGKKESLNEYMDEELPVLPFSAYNLKDIAVLTGLDNAEKTINSEFGVDFCNIIAKLCFEIASLYGFLGEHVNTIQETSELQSFLFDLSAFLGELECPHESITCGPLEDRFLSRTRRSFLFNYLISEIRTARLYAAQQLQNNEKNIYASSVPVAVSSALYTLNASHGTGNLIGAVDALKHETEKALQSLSNPPKPLFQPHSMKEDTWKDIEKVARSLAQDCRSRHLILLKRMDVTINSFLWSDRVRKQENKIRKLYMEQREKLAEVSVPGIPDLVSASDLLRIEPASNSKRRLHTRSKVKPTALEGTPTDRGGRTDDLHGFKNESFSKQYHNRGNRGRDRHHRNQEHGNGQNVSQEQKVREEYTGRNRGGQGEHRGGGGRNRRN